MTSFLDCLLLTVSTLEYLLSTVLFLRKVGIIWGFWGAILILQSAPIALRAAGETAETAIPACFDIRLTAYRRKDILVLNHHQRNDARCLQEPSSEKNLREGV